MLFQRALKGVGEVKKKEGGEEERKECGGEGEYAPLALEDGRPRAETQIDRQEDHFHCTSLYPRVPKVGGGTIFIVPPCTPGSQKWGDNVPHTPRLRRP